MEMPFVMSQMADFHSGVEIQPCEWSEALTGSSARLTGRLVQAGTNPWSESAQYGTFKPAGRRNTVMLLDYLARSFMSKH